MDTVLQSLKTQRFGECCDILRRRFARSIQSIANFPTALFVSKFPAGNEPGGFKGLAASLLALPCMVMVMISEGLKARILLRPLGPFSITDIEVNMEIYPFQQTGSFMGMSAVNPPRSWKAYSCWYDIDTATNTC